MNQFFETLDKRVYNFFNLSDIFENHGLRVLYLFTAGNLAFFMYQLYSAIGVSIFSAPCNPALQNCKPVQDLIFLNHNPELRVYIYMYWLVFFVLFSISILYRKFGWSFILLGILFLTSLLPVILTTDVFGELIQQQYHYLFYTFLCFYLVTNKRIFFLSLFYALSYLGAGVAKMVSIDWMLGNFSFSFINGEYMFFATILITILQLVSPYLLLYGSKITRLLTVFIQESFHIFSASIIFVSYSFSTFVLPFLYILFIYSYEKPNFQEVKKQYLGFLIIILFLFLAFVRLIIPGEDYFTQEGSKYTFNMYGCNYACKTYFEDRNMSMVDADEYIKKWGPVSYRFKSFYCQGYESLYTAWGECVDNKPRKMITIIENQFFKHEVMNEENYCALQFKPFSKNYWIKDADYSILSTEKMNKFQVKVFENRNIFFGFYYFLTFYVMFGIAYVFFRKEK